MRTLPRTSVSRLDPLAPSAWWRRCGPGGSGRAAGPMDCPPTFTATRRASGGSPRGVGRREAPRTPTSSRGPPPPTSTPDPGVGVTRVPTSPVTCPRGGCRGGRPGPMSRDGGGPGRGSGCGGDRRGTDTLCLLPGVSPLLLSLLPRSHLLPCPRSGSLLTRPSGPNRGQRRRR